jgi:hypothetical protein
VLLLVIVALIATTAFYRRAKAGSVHPGKAASVPFIAAGIFFVVGYSISYVLGMFAAWSDAAPVTVRLILRMADAFLVLAYLLFISRNWNALAAVTSQSNER